MTAKAIYLQDWSGRAFSIESKQDFQRFVRQPALIHHDPAYRCPCPTVPARLRGKSSPLSRLVMAPFFELMTIHQLDPSNIDIVFASRFGEIQVLASLLDTIYRDEALSPLDFCNSVHHTATGYLSIAAGNQGISRTVSAGEFTFAAGLLETWQLLITRRSEHVALLVGDETVPAFFTPGEKYEFTFGMALLFGIEERTQNEIEAVSQNDIMEASRSPLSAPDWIRRRYNTTGEL